MYSIGAVSTMTGVNPITLRAWERRFGLINPVRTPKGHRKYSDKDIATIKRMLVLLDQGITVSQVGQYLDANTLADSDKTRNHWLTYHDRMLKAVIYFDEQILEQTYSEAMSLYPVDIVTKELLIPLLDTLGQRWLTNQCGIGEEHFFSGFVRNKLGSRFHHRNLNNRGVKILAACLPGEYHELGLLVFTLAAHECGYQIIMLGANMPINELSEIAGRTKCVAIALSATTLVDVDKTTKELTELVIDLDIPVFIGGKVVQQNSDLINAIGAIPTAADINGSLNILNNHLTKNMKKGASL